MIVLFVFYTCCIEFTAAVASVVTVGFGRFHKKPRLRLRLLESIRNLRIHLRLAPPPSTALLTWWAANAATISSMNAHPDIRPVGHDSMPSCLSVRALFDLHLTHSACFLSWHPARNATYATSGWNRCNNMDRICHVEWLMSN